MSACTADGGAQRPIQGPRNSFRVASPGETALVLRANEKQQLTGRHEVDTHTALVRGLAEYLGQRTLELGDGKQVRLQATFYDAAEPEDRALYPSANVYGVGRGEYDARAMTPQVERDPLFGDKHIVSPAEYVQTLGIQIFATSPQERGNAAALIEEALYPVTWMAGFRLRLPFYFGAYGSYEIASNEFIDSADAALKRDRRAAFLIVGRLQVLQLRSFAKGDPRFRAEVTSPQDG